MSVPESTVKTMKIWKIPLKELWEETGAKIFDLTPICIYSVLENDSVIENSTETFGMLYFASITSFGDLPPLEMERIVSIQI